MKLSPLTILEWMASLLLTARIVMLLVVRTLFAGGLWRDECASVQLAQLPTWLEVQQKFQFEAFPLLFPALIRTLTSLAGTDDVVFRFYGLAVGLMLVAALWCNAWWLQRSPPLLALALLGLNPTFLIWGTTVRGYGIACVMIALAFGCMANARQHPQRGWIVAAFLTSFASVQFALHNCFLLLAICLSAATVSLIRREYRSAAIVLGIGAVCGLSILPYWAGYRSADWTMLVKVPVSFFGLVSKMFAASGGDVPLLSIAWFSIVIGSLVAGIVRLCLAPWKPLPNAESANLILYALGILILAPAAYLGFLMVLSYPTQSWYYLLLMTVLACASELIVSQVSNSNWWRTVRLLAVMGILRGLPTTITQQMQVRNTNVDLIARQLEGDAVDGDLIVVSPWYMGVSFQWYYHGTADWITVPVLSDLSMHRYDLFKEKMLSPHPLEDVKAKVEQALESQHRVWLVGEVLPVPAEGPHVLPLPPAPYTGWSDEAYRIAWSEQLTAYLQRHGRKFHQAEVPNTGAVSGFENASVWTIEGWRD
ncbi:hypothetical protein SH661x_000790 [Planctomicrobium sp. SH661]|uniref:hypothetical protein n=1 Tax=Planctomicrobium sp. SH661 TaxID=3448124 RepID=UPI003F5BA120